MAREEESAAGTDEIAETGETEPVTSGVDAAAMGLAMNGAGHDPKLAAAARAYFEQQTRYVHTLLEHLHEQRSVQIGLLEMRRISQWLRLCVQGMVTLAVGFAVFYGFVLVYDALRSHALIVTPFSTPPALSQRGITPTVLGGAVLDQLARLRLAARSNLSGHTLAASWVDRVELEVPETGVSIDQIARILRQRFGHDAEIGGDLTLNADGTVTLTIRSDGVEAKRFTGPEASWPDLARQATEYVYGRVEPALYAMYLTRSGRYAQAVDFSHHAVLAAPTAQLPFLYNAWAVALDNLAAPLPEQLALEERAIRLMPHYWIAIGNAMIDARAMGEEERAWRIGRALPRSGSNPAVPAVAYTTWHILTGNALAIQQDLLADAERHGGVGSSAIADDAQIAQADADLHDAADARLRLLSLDPHDPNSVAAAAYVRGVLAEQAGETATAATELEAYGAALASPAMNGGDTSFHCDVAKAEILAGQFDRAAAEIAAGGRFVECLWLKGDLKAATHDWPGALAAYHAAIALAPDLPAGYYGLGVGLARHGDARGAAAALRQAVARGPGWAEPYVALGDVLAQQGHWERAARWYGLALARAPAWASLAARRDAALARK